MNKQRLEALSDGIFAIVMTLLVIDVKVLEPEILNERFFEASNLDAVFNARPVLYMLWDLRTIFISFFLSFALITTYWLTQNFIVSKMAKTMNRALVNLNLLFLAFVSLTPFSAHLIGTYPESRTAVGFYALNVSLVALTSFVIREYVIRSKHIENTKILPEDNIYGNLRIVLGVFLPLTAVVVSIFNTYLAIAILFSLVIMNIIPGSMRLVSRVTGLEKLVQKNMIES